MKKILKINLFLLLLFFAFNIKVRAIPSLTCRYRTTALPNYFEYVALVQDSYGKMGIFFSRDNISYSNLNEFKNGTVYIENFSKNFITSGNYPYFNDCPQYFFLDIYYDPELTLNLSDGNDKYYEENKSNYTYLIGKDDIRKEIFDDLEFPDSLEVYNELDEKSYSITGIEKWIDSTGRPETPSTDEEHIYKEKLDYNSLCSLNSKGNIAIRKIARILGIILSIAKIVVPLIIIIFGIVDFTKAIVASDEKAISKATSSLIRRFIAGLFIYIIPIIILAILNVIEVTKGIEKNTDTDFGACTKCIFDPYKNCPMTSDSNDEKEQNKPESNKPDVEEEYFKE